MGRGQYYGQNSFKNETKGIGVELSSLRVFKHGKMLVQKGRKQKLYMDTLQSLRMEDLEKTGAISVASYNYAIEDGNHS